MKTKLNLLVAGMFLAAVSSALATVRFVWQSSPGPAPPYTNWATAAHVIQDALDAALAGDEVVVTNGTYATGGRQAVYGTETDRVAVDKPLALRSVNGPQFTLIEGHQATNNDGNGAIRCVYLASDATLVGFTLTNGMAYACWGGGVYCTSTNSVLTNCVLAGNSGSGAYGATLNNCILTGNSAGYGILGGGYGGGANGCALNNCTLTSNRANYGGGAYGGTLNHCTVAGNSVREYWEAIGGGWPPHTQISHIPGFGGGAYGATLNNCVLTGNSANSYVFLDAISAGGGADSCRLNNCTLTGNSADDGGGADSCTLNNCIVYFNSGPNGGNY